MYRVSFIILLSFSFVGCTRPQKTDLSNLPIEQTIESQIGGHPIKVREFTIGSGESAKKGDFLKVHFVAKSQTDNQILYSSYKTNIPYSFKIGAGDVIPAWDQGLIGVRVGTKRRLIASSGLAYQDLGVMGVIPPNQTLVFDIEVLAVNDLPIDEKKL